MKKLSILALGGVITLAAPSARAAVNGTTATTVSATVTSAFTVTKTTDLVFGTINLDRTKPFGTETVRVSTGGTITRTSTNGFIASATGGTPAEFQVGFSTATGLLGQGPNTLTLNTSPVNATPMTVNAFSIQFPDAGMSIGTAEQLNINSWLALNNPPFTTTGGSYTGRVRYGGTLTLPSGVLDGTYTGVWTVILIAQ
jgi:hypothetical protein